MPTLAPILSAGIEKTSEAQIPFQSLRSIRMKLEYTTYMPG